jgi:predicted HTH transcriptional regulator
MLPLKWVHGVKLPFQESNLVEFKEVSIFSGLFKHTQSPLPKYKETIVGFLNGGHGYLILGIRNDGTIIGVDDMTTESIDKFKLWIDSCFNTLIYRDGKPMDPSEISINFKAFPVENRNSNIVVIHVLNKGLPMNIMTRSGTIIYRLNASNFKLSSEPVYRKRDVKGMIQSIQTQMRETIDNLQTKHEQILKGQDKEMKEYIEQISKSLYEKYKIEEPLGIFCNCSSSWTKFIKGFFMILSHRPSFMSAETGSNKGILSTEIR